MSVAHSELIVDYIVFLIFIVGTTIWPLWTRKKTPQTKANYVFAVGGGVSMAAMMLSLARGTLGVRTFLGSPSELFYRGSAMWETVYGMALAFPLVSILFIPVYYPLGITSIYQYLDLRFKSRAVRCFASATYIFRQVLNLGTAVFTPCVALNTVIGLPYWVSIIGITSISVLFTIFGGLKAAIKADVIQGLTMIFISVVIIIQCFVEVDGISPVFKLPYERERLQFFKFTGDLSVRIDTTSALFGQLFMSLSLYGCQQNFVQRYCSMKTEKDVRRTLTYVIPLLIVLFSLSWICGMGIFATYADCDPLSMEYITKMDEILPFFMEDKFAYFPGLMGLFLGSLFNGALSIAVSNINSLATVTFEDFLSHTPAFSKMKDSQQVITIKVVGVFYGVIIMGISFCVGMLPGVMESGILMTSATSGPLLGVFILAMFVPCATWKGAISGMLASHVLTIWATIGHFVYDRRKVEMLPLSTMGCTNETFSTSIMKPGNQWPISFTPLEVNKNTTHFLQYFNHLNTTKVLPAADYSYPLQPFYKMSYMYYALFGTFTTVSVGIIVSLLCKRDESDAYEENLLHPFVLKLSKRFFKKSGHFTSTSKDDSLCSNTKTACNGGKTTNEIDNPAFEMCTNFDKKHSVDVEIVCDSQRMSMKKEKPTAVFDNDVKSNFCVVERYRTLSEDEQINKQEPSSTI